MNDDELDAVYTQLCTTLGEHSQAQQHFNAAARRLGVSRSTIYRALQRRE